MFHAQSPLSEPQPGHQEILTGSSFSWETLPAIQVQTGLDRVYSKTSALGRHHCGEATGSILHCEVGWTEIYSVNQPTEDSAEEKLAPQGDATTGDASYES